ncbi:MAG: DUF4384 domain-containing protein [Acidobacteria bacterium]|nr:DUF4384 domain-containing protein [Acidobacteriota bacterium]
MPVIGSLLLPLVLSSSSPKVAAQVDSVTYDKPVAVERKEKPRRKMRKPRPKPTRQRPKVVEQVPLLAVQYRILKVDMDGAMQETNGALNTFFANDRLRLAVKANQDGYLYVIHQSSKEANGQLIFPQSRVNNGQNYVTKNQELILPSGCPTGTKPADCSFIVMPPAGQEYFTLIFSRDMLLDLPNLATEAGGGVRPEVIQQLLNESGQSLEIVQGDTKFALKIVNINTKDNEEIIKTLVLNKGG